MRHVGVIVAGSLATGVAAASALAAAPFVPAEENSLTGAVLCGFAVGWAMLAVLTMRFTDHPQRWAAVPASVMGVGGLLLVVFGPQVQPGLSWVWPPVVLAMAIWMIARIRGRFPGRGRWMLYPLCAVLALVALGGGYETVREATDAAAYPMPGRLVDVGGHRLHLSCTGSGGPTVVLEPGAGETSADFGWVAPAVARETRVCVYDRAGRGWSEPADTRQDASRVATDLHTLLRRGHVPGPYVLAGHSFGGLYALTFAARYPDEVAGLVLVDSTAPKPDAAAPPSGDDSSGLSARTSALVAASAQLGVARLSGLTSYGSLPPRSAGEARAGTATTSSLHSTVEEYAEGEASTREAASLRDFGAKPLVVLTAGAGHDAAWTSAQNELAALSTNSTHRVVDGATHASMILDEEAAAATTRAVLDVVASVRTAEPLVS